MKTKTNNIILSFIALGAALLLSLLYSCSNEPFSEEGTNSPGKPLAPGEVCSITFANSVDGFSEVTTRSIPEGKESVLQDFTNHELKSTSGGRAGWLSSEIRTKYDEEVQRAATRSFTASQLFGANSKFRMLVFAGTYGGTVDMTSPVANVVCQVNSTGNGASFISPVTELGLLKGRYTFICFPANEKYNLWQVGQNTGFEIPVGVDEDFVCMQIANQDLNNTNYAVNLSLFKRYGYQLTVKFSVNEELGYLLSPQDKLELEVSDAGSGTAGRVINTGATFNLKSNAVKDYSGNTSTFKDTLTIDKAGMGQTFSAVSNLLIANNSASQKLTIKYPRLTVLKPAGTDGSKEDSVFTIKGGTYTTSEAVTFEAGKSYTITLAIGEQVKGIVVAGIIWSPGNLDYDGSKFFWAPGPDKAKNAREARGAWFRWFSPLPQSSSNTSSSYPIQTTWTVTTPKWSGNSKDLGNYNGYYKGVLNNSSLTSGTLPATLTATTLGDPCWGMGKGWRMPTYNEIYLLCYVSPSATPSGTFTTARNRLESFSSYSGSFSDNTTSSAAIYSGIYITSSGKPNENPAKITSTSQYDGSQLFLPAAGYSDGSSVGYTGSNGYYWSSTPYVGTNGNAWTAYFTSGRLNPSLNGRYYGFCVRCVLGD